MKNDYSLTIVENVSFPITSHCLNGNNYRQWSSFVFMFVSRKGKDEYLIGKITPPKPKDASYRKWKPENNMVKSWLINSMVNEIGDNFWLYETTDEIWEAAREFYSTKDSTSAIFEFESVIHDLRQGSLNATQYYNAFLVFGNSFIPLKSMVESV